MNRTTITFVTAAIALSAHSAQNDWENERMIEQGKLSTRATSYSYKTAEDALNGCRELSRMVSLNGDWKFKFTHTDKSLVIIFISI
jgi:beta-galactosidase